MRTILLLTAFILGLKLNATDYKLLIEYSEQGENYIEIELFEATTDDEAKLKGYYIFTTLINEYCSKVKCLLQKRADGDAVAIPIKYELQKVVTNEGIDTDRSMFSMKNIETEYSETVWGINKLYIRYDLNNIINAEKVSTRTWTFPF